MKKLITILLAFVFVILLTACGSEKELTEPGNNISSETTQDNNKSDSGNSTIESDSISVDALLKSTPVLESDLVCTGTESGGVRISRYSGEQNLVVLPDTYQGKAIQTLDKYVFGVNSNVQAIKFPASLITVGEMSCATNPSLEIVVFGSSVEEVGDSAFQGCNLLSTVILNDGLKSIGKYSFAQCSNLKQIEIPSSVEEIDEYAFYGHPSDFVIIGDKGSYAEEFASAKNIPFEEKK